MSRYLKFAPAIIVLIACGTAAAEPDLFPRGDGQISTPTTGDKPQSGKVNIDGTHALTKCCMPDRPDRAVGSGFGHGGLQAGL